MLFRIGLAAAILLIFSVASTPHAGTLSRWVDEKGVTHYEARPPANAKSGELQLRDPTGGPSDKSRAASPSVAEQEADFRQRRIQRAEAEAKEAKDMAQRQMRCRSLRSSADAMKKARRVYSVNEKGERVLMSNEERDALIEKREADYNRSC
jgi:hypothetical protein